MVGSLAFVVVALPFGVVGTDPVAASAMGINLETSGMPDILSRHELDDA
jgi:hypothetical protein